jgi:Hypervirulence associated proteins TUDOR domain
LRFGRTTFASFILEACEKEDIQMAKNLKKGDEVEWKSSQGTIKGTVVRRVTRPMEIKGHHVAADADNPEILVMSKKTGALAAHKPGSLKKGK